MAKPKTKRAVPDRSKISMENEAVVRYWTKHLGVTRERSQSIVEKVGNSAASVLKELKSYDLCKPLEGTEAVKSG
jgi:3-oxoacyl-[acyl-carrier-protein] synthase III